MKQLWLEKMAEDGLIRKEALEHIYNDVKTMAKEATAGIPPEEMTKHIQQLIGMGVIGAGVLGYKALSARRDQAKGRDAILKARAHVLGQYKDPDDLAKAQARLDEIMQYAPHVAMNQNLASKLVHDNLHSGISDETAQRLALIQSQYTLKATEQGKYMPKTGSVRPEVVGEMMADLYIMSKTASLFTGKGLKKFVSTVATYSAVPLVTGAIAGLANMAMDKAREDKLQERMEQSFHEAINKAPEIHKDIFMQDMSRTREAFEALSHFAPHVALQPHAARTFIKKMLDYYDQGGMNVTDVKELTEIEKNISSSSKPRGFGRGFELGTSFAAAGAVGKGVENATNEMLSPRPDPGNTAAVMAKL